nr:hypothetical protein [Pandoravirus massiliensis]
MPVDTLVAILSFVPSTADLARLAMVSSTLRAVSSDVRFERAHRRFLTHDYAADHIGCAHALANAIMADNVVAMIDVLDTGAVIIDEPLDVEYLQAVAVPNTVVFVSQGSVADQFQPLHHAHGMRGPSCFAPLGVAVINGASRCARALVSMGARMDAESAASLVAFVLDRTAWRYVHASNAHMLSPVIEIAWPCCRAKRLLDPVDVLAPLLDACTPSELRPVAARRGFLGMARRAALRRLCRYDVYAVDGDDYDHTASVPAWEATGPYVDMDVATLVEYTRRLVQLLLRHGCDPRDPTPSAVTREEMRHRWRMFVCEKRRPPSTQDVAAWRAGASSATEYDVASTCLERARMAGHDKTLGRSPARAAVSGATRDVIAALVDLYDGIV